MNDLPPPSHDPPDERLTRRALLAGATAAAGAVTLGALAVRALRPPPPQFDPRRQSPVFLAGGQRYEGDLERTVRDGLLATGLEPARIKGLRVLLKPNMVEPTRASPQMTTHPSVVRAVAEVFRRWDATVVVGEAPGHVRDTEMALEESRLGPALDDDKLPFADLNYEEVGWVANAGRRSELKGLYFPQSVLEADLVVSLPKLKTHHWQGMTAALKNMYGTLPGIKYGWPKNVLHRAGIPETVVDINASLPRTVAVVDAIVCMEGDGPILGSAKPLGMLAVGSNATALDATCARIMGFDPWQVPYLAIAAGFLGPLAEADIAQRGEKWQALASPFAILDKPWLRRIQAARGELTS